ncbi:hypothetical protein [Paractinoplanes globisporus]|uniref:Uncharacterized protein n=1 Tax=Paractinoplanes globisporus TaxID=113565 RepID=A0ABW6W6X1_9ACTN|nr:hypothetical protein [Actinoplanes globisporus]
MVDTAPAIGIRVPFCPSVDSPERRQQPLYAGLIEIMQTDRQKPLI